MRAPRVPRAPRVVRARGTAVVVALVAGVGAAAAVVGALHVATGVVVVDLLTDPPATTGASPWTGAASTLGLLGWCAAAVLLGATAWIRGQADGDRRRGRFLAEAAVLVGLVLLDDAYQLHEVVLPEVLGVGEYAVYGAYGVIGAAWAVRWRAELRAAPVSLLAAIAALAASLAADALTPVKDLAGLLPVHPLVVEELLKMAAIGALVAFAAQELRRSVRSLLPRGGAPQRRAGGAPAAPGGAGRERRTLGAGAADGR